MAHSIQVTGQGKTYQQEDGDTVLHSALRQGIAFPHECSAGSCGTCRFELVTGAVKVNWEAAPAWTERDRRKGRYLGCQTSAVADCTVKVAVDEVAAPMIRLRRQQARLLDKRFLTHDMAMLTLRGTTAAEFLPGQFALLGLSDGRLRRPYSMSNLPNKEGIWQFVVRRTPGGAMSPTLLDASPGELVLIDAPLGVAYFQDSAQEPVVCVAGGSGLAPMLSIAKAAATTGQEIHFFYGGRRSVDMSCLHEIEKIGTGGARLNIYSAISEPEESADAWPGRRGFLHEVVDEVLGNQLQHHRVYMAGAPLMISAMQGVLNDRDVPTDRIHYDRFL